MTLTMDEAATLVGYLQMEIVAMRKRVAELEAELELLRTEG